MKTHVITRVVMCAVVGVFLLASSSAGSEQAQAKNAPTTISNMWVESDLRAVLSDIAQQAGINIVASQEVQGAVTFEAKRVPLEKCLGAVLAPGGYVYKKLDDYYLVGSADPASPSFSLLAETRMLVLKHTDAHDVRTLLPKCFSRYAQTASDKSIITITAPRNLLDQVVKAIRDIDVAPKQVLIEAVVTELSEDAGKELGLSWEWEWDTSTLAPNASASTEEGIKGHSTASGIVDMTRSNSHFPGSLAYATTGSFTRLLKLNLQLLVSEGRAKIRANPRIMALNGTTAEIHVGKEQYYAFLVDASDLEAAGINDVSNYTIKEITSGVTLKVTPRIGDDGQITVVLAPEVSEVASMSKQGLPILNKRTAKATVRVKSGETIVLGGLTQSSEHNVVKKVPVLGDIPLLGWLFKTVEKETARKEIAILITPRLVLDGKVVREGTGNENVLEERLIGMAQDISANNIVGIRARLANLQRRLCQPVIR